MKSTIRSSCTIAFVAAAFSLFVDRPLKAATYTWTQTVGGAQSWITGGNWSGGSAPSPASGDIVDLSTVNIAANTTLTLGADRTAATWKFGDTSGTQNWTVNSGNKIVLAGTTPGFNVVQNTTTLNNVVDGTAGLTKSGAGTLTLSGANTYSAGTAINAGNVAFSSLTAVPSSGLIKINSGGALNASGAYTTVAGWLASGKVDTTSTGAIAITAANSETLDFSANGYGTLSMGASGAFTYSGTLTPSSSGYLLGGGGGTLTVSSALNNSGSALTVNGSGTVVLSGNNTYTGATTVSGGTLKLGAAGALGNGTLNTSGVTVSGSGIFDFGGISPTYAAPFTLNSTANAFDVGAIENTSGTAVTFAGAVTLQRQTRFGGGGAMLFTGSITGGGFNLIKDSTGLLELQSSGTVTLGAFQANRGTLQVDSGTTLNVTTITVGSGNSVGSGLTLNGGNVAASGAALFGTATSGTASGTLQINSGSTLTVPSLNKGGSAGGSVVFNANFNGGTLKANGNSTTFFSGANNARVQAGGAIFDDSGNTITISQTLIPDYALPGGNLTKQGAGTLMLAGVNTFVGTTTVNGGTLKVGNASALGFGGVQSTTTGGTTVNNGYTLDLNGATVTEPLTLNGLGVGNNGALINSSGSAATIGSGVAGLTIGSVTGTGSGYSSAPTVSISGTGSGAAATASLGLTAASITGFGGTASGWVVGDLVNITGGNGSGAVGYVTAVSSGVPTAVNFTGTGASPGAGYTAVPTGWTKNTSTAGTVASGTLTANANNFTVAGVAMTAAGSGYTGTPTYSFSAGNAVAGFVNLSSVVLASDSSLGGSGDMAINAVISQSGGNCALTKVGVGTLMLSGANTYMGNTIIHGGTLLVNSSLASGSAVTVASAARLAGIGNVAGNVLVNGTVSPGASVGTLTTGAETWNGGGTYLWEITTATNAATPGTPGTDWDLVNLSGNLTINSTNNAGDSGKFTIIVTNASASPLPANFDDTKSFTWKIAEVTDSGSSVAGFNAAKFLVVSNNFPVLAGTFSVVLSNKAVCVVYAPAADPCANVTMNWFSLDKQPSYTNAVLTFSNASFLVSVQALTLSNCTLTGKAYTNGGANLTDITGINLTSRTPLPYQTLQLVLTAVKTSQNKPAAVNALVIDTCGRGKSFDPVITTLAITSGNQVTQRFEGLLSAERYLRVINASPGLKWLEINLNGRVFRLDPLADGQDVAADLGSAMREGDNNVVMLTGGGDVGASAFVTITDTASDGMVALPEIVSLALNQTVDGLVLAWPDTLTGWELQASGTADNGWTISTLTPVSANGQFIVTVPATGGAQFYRLAGPVTSAAALAAKASGKTKTGISVPTPNQPQTTQLNHEVILW